MLELESKMPRTDCQPLYTSSAGRVGQSWLETRPCQKCPRRLTTSTSMSTSTHHLPLATRLVRTRARRLSNVSFA